MAQYSGVVKWFNNAKGFGLTGREDGPDVFVHYTSTKEDGYKSLKDIITGRQSPQSDL